MAYSEKEIFEILNYAKEYGVMKAAKKFNVYNGTIKRWNDEYKIYVPRVRREFSDDEKIKILTQVLTDGVIQTAYRNDISPIVLARWNAEFKIYPSGIAVTHGGLDNYTEEKKLEILQYTKEHGISRAARKYNVSQSLIQVWNAAYNYYETRPYTKRTPQEKAEILAYAAQHSVPQAARKYGLADGTIRGWLKQQKKR